MSMVELESFSRAFNALLFGTVLRSSLLAAACAVVIFLFRSRTAELKHFIWRGALFGLLALPLFQIAAPPLPRHRNVLSDVEIALFPAALSASTARNVVERANPGANIMGIAQPFPWMLIATALYAAIALALLMRLLLALVRLRRIVRRSELILDSDLQRLGHDIWLQSLSSSKPQLRSSSEVCVPIAIGISEASILLPSSWRRWQPDKLRAVLMHEIAHVRRRDPTTALIGSLAVCLFWLHPLSHWLSGKLAALAEEACDEVALQVVKPARYSRILIEFTADVAAARTRLLAASSVAMRKSRIEKRIERIFSFTPGAPKRPRMAKGLLLAAFAPALYLAAAQFNQPQNTNGPAADAIVSTANAAEAGELESDLQHDPENLSERGALMSFYANERNDAEFTKHLLWVIADHPDSPMAGMRSFAERGQETTLRNHELLKSAWEQALARYSNSAEVLYHAGLFFEEDEPLRALDFFRQAKSITPSEADAQSRYVQAMALVYSAALCVDLNPGNSPIRLNRIEMPSNTASVLRTELETSDDPDLLSRAGTILTRIGYGQLSRRGLAYLQKAVELDPGNPHWKEMLEAAKAEPVRRRNIREMTDSR